MVNTGGSFEPNIDRNGKTRCTQAPDAPGPSQSSSPVTAGVATLYKTDSSIDSTALPSTAATKTSFEDNDAVSFKSSSSEREEKATTLCCSFPLEKVQGVLLPSSTKSQRKLLCLFCERSFVSSNLRQKHVERAHSVKRNRRVSVRRQSQLSAIPCAYCDKLNVSEHTLNDLFRHMVAEHPSKYFGCLPCEDRFGALAQLEAHNSSKHEIRSATGVATDSSDHHVQSSDEDSVAPKITRSRSKTKLEDSGFQDFKKPLGVKKKGSPSIKDMRKSFSLKTTKVTTLKRSKRLQAQSKEVDTEKGKREKKVSINNKPDLANSTKMPEKTKSGCINPYPEFDNFYRIKKITDHSIDNLKISSLTFDDVFDKAFFNRIKCNIEENLLHHIDGKLFKNEESENRISNFEKVSPVAQTLQNSTSENYGCELSLNAVTPVAALSLNSQFGEDFESQIEYGSKPSKKKAPIKNDEIHYKYFTRRKYQASILRQKENRDLSKLDMWTQLVIKERQQKMINEKKSSKEMQEYTEGDEYKSKIKREELNRILDRRGPFEDLKEEVCKRAAFDKLNSSSDCYVSEEIFSVVREVLNDLLKRTFEGIEDDHPLPLTSVEKQIDRRDIPAYLNLRQTSLLPSEGDIDRSDRIALICSSQETENFELPTNKARGKDELVELTGEWARSRIYICGACARRFPNLKYLLEHKSVHHQNVWVQHYEFVGNQSELYRHLSIPVLGKVGVVEDTVQCKQWKRSEARTCTKCGKRCNSLGELHRHVLECAGDWTWLLARRKCKYKPFGAKSRRKRKGLVTQLHRKQKTEPSEKKIYKKSFDGPRPRPSDADTIQRMLANLPAKRLRRNIMSLQDVIFKTRKRKQSKTETKTKCGKTASTQTLASEKNPANKLTNTHQRQHTGSISSNRRSLRSLNKVLASGILDSNSLLRVKRKIKSVHEKRITRQTSQVQSLDSSDCQGKTDVDDTDSEKLVPPSVQPKGKKSQREMLVKAPGMPNVQKKFARKKILTSRLNIKNFFPVKKRNNRAMLTKSDIQRQNIKNLDVILQKTVNFDQHGGLENIAECSKVTSGGLKGLVRSLRKKNNSSELKVQQNLSKKGTVQDNEPRTSENVLVASIFNKKEVFKHGKEGLKSLSAKVTKQSTELNKPKKRKLNKSFRNVINKVSKLKIDPDVDTKEKTEIDKCAIFLEKPVSEEKRGELPKQNFISLEIRPESLPRGSPARVAEITIDSKENPPIPETIFNLNSKNEKSLQAKGELNFDKQVEVVKPSSETKRPTTIIPLAVETAEKLKIVPLMSPNIKGKIRKPNKGLNDCIAMLTSKLQQKEDRSNLTTAAPFSSSSERAALKSPEKAFTTPPIKPECILRIPTFKVTPPIQQKETALDLTKKSFSAPDLFYNRLANGISTFGNTLSMVIEGVIEHNCKEVFTQKLSSNWTSVDDIIQQVINDKDKKPEFRKNTSKNYFCVQNSVDETIESVVKGYQASYEADISAVTSSNLVKNEKKPPLVQKSKAKKKSPNTNLNKLNPFKINNLLPAVNNHKTENAKILSLLLKSEFQNATQNLLNGSKGSIIPTPLFHNSDAAITFSSQKPHNNSQDFLAPKNSESKLLIEKIVDPKPQIEFKNVLLLQNESVISVAKTDSEKLNDNERECDQNAIINSVGENEMTNKSTVINKVNDSKKKPKANKQTSLVCIKKKPSATASKQKPVKSKSMELETSSLNEINLLVEDVAAVEVADCLLKGTPPLVSDSEDELPLAVLAKQEEYKDATSLIESRAQGMTDDNSRSTKEHSQEAETAESKENDEGKNGNSRHHKDLETSAESSLICPKLVKKNLKHRKKMSKGVTPKTKTSKPNEQEPSPHLCVVAVNPSIVVKPPLEIAEENAAQIVNEDKGNVFPDQSTSLSFELHKKQTTRRKSKSSKKIEKDENDLFKDFSLVINKKTKRIPPTNIVDDSVCDEILQSLSKVPEDYCKTTKPVETQDDSVEEMDMEIEHIPFNSSIIERDCETEITNIFQNFDPTNETKAEIGVHNEPPCFRNVMLSIDDVKEEISVTPKTSNVVDRSREDEKLEQDYSRETIDSSAQSRETNDVCDIHREPTSSKEINPEQIFDCDLNGILDETNKTENDIRVKQNETTKNSSFGVLKTSTSNDVAPCALLIPKTNLEVKVVCKKLILSKKQKNEISLSKRRHATKAQLKGKSKKNVQNNSKLIEPASLRRSARSNRKSSTENSVDDRLMQHTEAEITNTDRNKRRNSVNVILDVDNNKTVEDFHIHEESQVKLLPTTNKKQITDTYLSETNLVVGHRNPNSQAIPNEKNEIVDTASEEVLKDSKKGAADDSSQNINELSTTIAYKTHQNEKEVYVPDCISFEKDSIAVDNVQVSEGKEKTSVAFGEEDIIFESTPKQKESSENRNMKKTENSEPKIILPNDVKVLEESLICVIPGLDAQQYKVKVDNQVDEEEKPNSHISRIPSQEDLADLSHLMSHSKRMANPPGAIESCTLLKKQNKKGKAVAALKDVLKMCNVEESLGNSFSSLNVFKNSLDKSEVRPDKHLDLFKIDPLNEIITSSDMDIAPVIDEIDKSLEIDDIYDFSEEFEDSVNNGYEKNNKPKLKTDTIANTDSHSFGRRTANRFAKVKALESIHDDAMAQLNEEYPKVVSGKKSFAKCRNKRIGSDAADISQKVDTFSIDEFMSSAAHSDIQKSPTGAEEGSGRAAGETIELNTGLDRDLDNMENGEAGTKSTDSSNLIVLPDVDQMKQELRRSRRGSHKVASYNENDLIDPLIEALENRRKGLKKHRNPEVTDTADRVKESSNADNSRVDINGVGDGNEIAINSVNADGSSEMCSKPADNTVEFNSDSKTTTSDGGSKSKNGKFKSPDKSIYCGICNKYFTRLESLMKHKGTLTHISKLSELEAKEAEMKALLEKEKDSEVVVVESTDLPEPKAPDLRSDINITNILQQNESFCVSSPKAQTSYTNNDTLKLADIISEVLNKPVLKPASDATSETSDAQNEYHRYKNLAERKSFDSDNLSSNKDISDDTFYNRTLSKTTILEKQISLLENIIENQTGGINFMDNIFQSSNNSHSENNCEFGGFVPTCGAVEPTQPTPATDMFAKPIQYEEISDDSMSIGAYEEQKSRKVLNRDEELFLECCSLLKSGSEVSNFSKKCNTASGDIATKQGDNNGVFDSRHLVQTAEDAHEYSDNSRTPTPLGDTYDDDASDSNDSLSSNWNLRTGKKFEIGKNFTYRETATEDLPVQPSNNDQLALGILGFKEVMQQFENVSNNSDSDEQNEVTTTEEVDHCKKPNDEFSSSEHKKIVTKGARKVFEGLKVSIPTEELDLAILTGNQITKKEETTGIVVESKAKSNRKSKPIKKFQLGSNILFKSSKKKSPLAESFDEKHDVYDFEETQDNTEIFTKPDFRSFRNLKGEKKKDSDSENDSPAYTDSIGAEAHSVSSASTFSVISTQKTDCSVENITKKKCMIMGRIFKNAAKSKADDFDEDIRHIPEIPEIDNIELVENYVLSCSRVKPSPPPEEIKKTKMTEEEMNMLFDQLLGKNVAETKPMVKSPPQPKPFTKCTDTRKKPKQKTRKRHHSNSSDDEFNINKTSKKRSVKKNGKEDNSINLEQELRECIGVASRKSQRKCTSGKQNVLVEYWSSDEEAFEALLESQKIQSKAEKSNDSVVAVDVPIPELQTPKDSEIKAQGVVPPHENAPLVQKKKFAKNKLLSCKKMSFDPFVTPNRRKRAAANPLYHWSSSSEDESQALIEVTSRDEEDEEDRPVQHGWIVGDSPKKLVTMLALTKGKKTDIECVKEQNRRRNNTVS